MRKGVTEVDFRWSNQRGDDAATPHIGSGAPDDMTDGNRHCEPFDCVSARLRDGIPSATLAIRWPLANHLYEPRSTPYKRF